MNVTSQERGIESKMQITFFPLSLSSRQKKTDRLIVKLNGEAEKGMEEEKA